MTPRSAVVINLFNIVQNTIATLAFQAAGANPTWTEGGMGLGVALFVGGIAVEVIAEFQRKAFKDDRRNEGKPYSGGLFGYARSINYFGYTMWRTGMALASGGWVWGVFTTAFFSYNFISTSIPELDGYCSKRYGVQWEELKKKVPYAFIPGVY